MRIHPIQTGTVKIKTAQVKGRGHGLVDIFLDPNWTDWVPTFAWAIEHPEGVIVVDSGQGTHLLEHSRELNPYVRWEVGFQIEREQEIGPQLRALGIGARDVRKVVLTHLHMDHDGGLAHFPNSEIIVPAGELAQARGLLGRLRGYLPHRWPTWFDPTPVELPAEQFGSFKRSRRLTKAGDIVAVATPGHTPNHMSVVVQDGDTAIFLAGDTSYNQALMLSGTVDGVSAGVDIAKATLDAIKAFAQSRPTIYLPTHDPESGLRLVNRQLAVSAG
ncbi:N-acyl homoserine lactonase family protein [Bradyrhizobium uaiense]|uniref:N-acyl homoserine lactonase family protein n=1 Tax=Bradyrhizobium uaiense TaxID=2594946 RepID=A0A6P1BBA0_9BRAD|nr:N-acyl homoserine lactonase family protein [Bradyrhizobium uaiense]NEU95687.1 N-acyl homoserine lactonase family protein [Bradyrhizobium uaiense]